LGEQKDLSMLRFIKRKQDGVKNLVKKTAATKVERRVGKSAAALLLSGQIGEQFDAIVTGVSDKGTWVRLFQLPTEGRLERGIQGLDVGDHVHVKLIHTEVERGLIDFARDGPP
jgi:exoribonuclease-2